MGAFFRVPSSNFRLGSQIVQSNHTRFVRPRFAPRFACPLATPASSRSSPAALQTWAVALVRLLASGCKANAQNRYRRYRYPRHRFSDVKLLGLPSKSGMTLADPLLDICWHTAANLYIYSAKQHTTSICVLNYSGQACLCFFSHRKSVGQLQPSFCMMAGIIAVSL